MPLTLTAADRQLAADALTVGLKYVGITENPPGTNTGPQVNVFEDADSLPGHGYAWCCSFGWCFCYSKALGRPVPFPTASVGALLDYAREHGWVHPIGEAIPGALLPFEFSGDHWPDHVGLARGKPEGSVIHTLEGNTSFDGAGSQSNGGCVALKTRPLSEIEQGVCIIPRGLVAAKPTPATHVIVGKPGTKDAKVYTPAQFAQLKTHGTYAVRRANGLVYYEPR